MYTLCWQCARWCTYANTIIYYTLGFRACRENMSVNNCARCWRVIGYVVHKIRSKWERFTFHSSFTNGYIPKYSSYIPSIQYAQFNVLKLIVRSISIKLHNPIVHRMNPRMFAIDIGAFSFGFAQSSWYFSNGCTSQTNRVVYDGTHTHRPMKIASCTQTNMLNTKCMWLTTTTTTSTHNILHPHPTSLG